MIGVYLLVALASVAVSIYMWHWRRRSRAEWKAYDAEHHGDDNPLLPSIAAHLAKDELADTERREERARYRPQDPV